MHKVKTIKVYTINQVVEHCQPLFTPNIAHYKYFVSFIEIYPNNRRINATLILTRVFFSLMILALTVSFLRKIVL